MKTLRKGLIEATIYGNKISVCDEGRNIEVVFSYPYHQTEESALAYCIAKYETKNEVQS